MTPERRRRLRNIAVALLTALVLATVWFRGIHPARGLGRGEIVEIVMATNRIHQSLWQTGYSPEDCTVIEQMDPRYTCYVIGRAADRLQEAVSQTNRSHYMLGKPRWDDPVHIVSFKMAAGDVYLLAVQSLAEADEGIFYGYWAKGQTISGDEIRWFRYTNPELGRVLKEMRTRR